MLPVHKLPTWIIFMRLLLQIIGYFYTVPVSMSFLSNQFNLNQLNEAFGDADLGSGFKRVSIKQLRNGMPEPLLNKLLGHYKISDLGQLPQKW